MLSIISASVHWSKVAMPLLPSILCLERAYSAMTISTLFPVYRGIFFQKTDMIKKLPRECLTNHSMVKVENARQRIIFGWTGQLSINQIGFCMQEAKVAMSWLPSIICAAMVISTLSSCIQKSDLVAIGFEGKFEYSRKQSYLGNIANSIKSLE